LGYRVSLAGANVIRSAILRRVQERLQMGRVSWSAVLGSLVLCAAACDDEPTPYTGPLGDAGRPVVILDASSSVPDAAAGLDAQVPVGPLPAGDTGVAPAPADTGVVAPIPSDAGRSDAGPGPADTGVAPADAQTADAQAGDAAAPSGDASTTPRFPAVTDTGAKGPYTATTINSTGPSSGYTVYHPSQLAPGGALNPIVAWGNGGFTTPDLYPLLPHLASHGFVVIASNNPFVVGDEVRAGIDWIAQQNDTASSPFYKKLDVRNVAGVGYSNGGLANLDVANDPRLVTIVIISGANVSADLRTANTPKLRTPMAYLCTEDDASRTNCAEDYAVASVPAFFGVIKGSDHFSVVLSQEVIDLLNMSTTAWLRWQQMGDQSFKARFVGASCGLCTDAKWTVQQKNLQ
jgi:dienelactone hydrolase